MAILPVLTYPDPRLKHVAKPVDRVNDEIRTIINDMLDTMYSVNCVGLAAIQVGIEKRIVVMDLDFTLEELPNGTVVIKNKKPIKMVNPEIIYASPNKSNDPQGCASVPDQYGYIERPAIVKIRFLDEHGQSQEIEGDGLFATCVQHEIDHLDGILFIDRMSRLKREMVLKKYNRTRQTQPV
jgi:peptide deformylase